MSTKTNALLIFSPAFAADETDTAWLPSLQNFARALNKNFPQLKVIVFAFQYPHSDQKYNWHKTEVIPFNGLHKNKASRLMMWAKIFIHVRQIKRSHEVLGILSMWCTECAFVGKYAARFFRLIHFCWVVGQDARAANTYVKRIRPQPSSLITISDFLVDEFYKNHRIKPRYVIPMGIDISLFAPQAKKDIDVIGAGSLSKLKQYHLFVEIVAKLKKNFPGLTAMLCGDGEDRNRIKEMVSQHSMEEYLALSGHLPYADVLKLMQRSKILLHPSSYEGFGMVCLEALYAGAHVISFTKPMHHNIKNWHVVKTTDEMQAKASELLASSNTVYEAVLVYSMDDTAKAIISLFRYGGTPDR